MAELIFYLANALSDGWQRLEDVVKAEATLAVGWTVGTGATNHSELQSGAERSSSTFTGTTAPDGVLNTTLKDAFRTELPLTGDFAAGDWVFTFAVRSPTQGGAADGRMRFRIIKAGADGSNMTEVTSDQQLASVVTDVTNAADADSTLTVSLGAISLVDQYLFVQIAWERTGAGGMTNTNIRLRAGAATSGTQITTTNFTTSTASEVEAAFISSVAVLFAPTTYYVQTAVPVADVAVGSWTPSTGTDLYPMVDESVADDNDYIRSVHTSTVARLALSSLNINPDVATLRIRFRKTPS